MKGLIGKEYLDSILDEQEQTYLVNFVDNEEMVQTVKKVLTAGLYEQGVLKKGRKADLLSNAALTLVCQGKDVSNEQIGADLRGFWEGLRIIEGAFDDMLKYKTIEQPKADLENKAR